MDGALSDSIPVHKALADGNKRAVAVLTRPKGYRKKPMKNNFLLQLFYRKYPKLTECIQNRAMEYNHTLDQIEQLEKEGKVFIIRPTEAIAVSRLENNPANLQKAYDNAIKQMVTEMQNLYQWLKDK
jgi:predicted patatin/cPLA2 family phospholipase